MYYAYFLILIVITGTHGFLPYNVREHRLSSARSKLSLNVSAKNTVERRDVLTGALLLISSTAVLAGGRQLVSPPTFIKDETLTSPVSATTIQQLSSVDEILGLIESSCDRRYLHAVVASDYKLMYRGVPTEESNFASVHINEASDLLLPSTYNSKEALKFFNILEERMHDKPIKPSNGHLSTTSTEAAKVWGENYASVWPLAESDKDDVHFAWLEDAGEFWPTISSNEIVMSNINDFANSKKIIFDGIDCGRMSLDDALEKKGGKDYEIMFRAKKFLLVPSRYEQELISGLKGAFII